jgi:tryptophan-rich sensory protein
MMTGAMADEIVDAPADGGGHRLVRGAEIGTAAFVAVVAIAIPLRDERPAQVAVAVVSMVLFAVGAVAALWAYIAALERSRTHEIGVANLYLLTGPTAPRPIKLRLSLLLVAQVVVAFGGAIIGAAGLSGSQVNALAFGILVPMFGIGVNGAWAVRHGRFGPRRDPSVQPTDRPID